MGLLAALEVQAGACVVYAMVVGTAVSHSLIPFLTSCHHRFSLFFTSSIKVASKLYRNSTATHIIQAFLVIKKNQPRSGDYVTSLSFCNPLLLREKDS